MTPERSPEEIARDLRASLISVRSWLGNDGIKQEQERLITEVILREREMVREECGRMADDLLNTQTLKLHAGEMTLQEVRTCKELIRYIAKAIRGQK